ncbi:hypothetical protein ABPG74_016893 [Tetrahymena malaccensis]
MSNPQKHQPGILSTLQPFLIGGVSGMFATLCIQPIDTVKVRIQILSEDAGRTGQKVSVNPITVAKQTIASDGVAGLYRGLDSAIMRQALYATVRLGLFRTISDKIKEAKKRNLTILEKAGASLTAGFFGSIIGNPADLALVRFQADTLLPKDQRRNYKHVFDALFRIVKEEGFFALWKGCTPTVYRALVINLGMLSTFDEVKERLNAYTNTVDTLQTRVIASGCSGIIASLMSLPVDNAKTKIQRMKPDENGKLPYSGFVDCMRKSAQREGILGLWVGLPTFITRVAPHIILTLLAQDAITIYVNARKNH